MADAVIEANQGEAAGMTVAERRGRRTEAVIEK